MLDIINKHLGEEYSINDARLLLIKLTGYNELQVEKYLNDLIISRYGIVLNVIESYLYFLLDDTGRTIEDYLFKEDIKIIRQLVFADRFNVEIIKNHVKNNRDPEETLKKLYLNRDFIDNLVLTR